MDLSATDLRVALLEQRLITLEQQHQHLKFCLTMVASFIRDRLAETLVEVEKGNAALDELTTRVEALL